MTIEIEKIEKEIKELLELEERNNKNKICKTTEEEIYTTLILEGKKKAYYEVLHFLRYEREIKNENSRNTNN